MVSSHLYTPRLGTNYRMAISVTYSKRHSVVIRSRELYIHLGPLLFSAIPHLLLYSPSPAPISTFLMGMLGSGANFSGTPGGGNVGQVIFSVISLVNLRDVGDGLFICHSVLKRTCERQKSGSFRVLMK
ncbi:hypothetical protein CDAR_368261 [Caerostris darwini]|uniref:Uncharacterized protein n=1 Tax=Caerostris darwini TaxID=1538125 RepID=A0AAV4WD28_9ARAC|nr:hypothetical protein CDAR_368261 [Caerostris darwini]